MADLSPVPSPASPNQGERRHGLDAMTGAKKPRPEPLDPPMVPFAVGGIAIFTLAGAILLLTGADDTWLWTCLAGILCGIPGLTTMLIHDAHRRTRRALTHPEFTITDPA